MKKYFAVIPAILAFSLNSMCQVHEMEKGVSFTLANAFVKIITVDSLGNTWFLTSNKAGDLFVEKQELNKDKPAISTKILPATKEESWLAKIFESPDGITFINEKIDKRYGKRIFTVNSVDWNGVPASEKMKEFLVINEPLSQGGASINIFNSPDRTKTGITYRPAGSEKIAIYSFDKSFTQQSEKSITLYRSSKRGIVIASDFSITNNGDFACVMEKISVTRSDMDYDGYESWLYVMPYNSKSIDSASIFSESEHELALNILSVKIEQNEIVIFGLVHPKDTNTFETEFCRYSMEKKDFVLKTKQNLTPEVFITKGAPNQLSKNMPHMLSYSFKSPNGYYYVLDPTDVFGGGGPFGIGTFGVGASNSYVFSLNKSGEVNWVVTVFQEVITRVHSKKNDLYKTPLCEIIRQNNISLFGNKWQLVGENLICLMNDDPRNVPQSSNSESTIRVKDEGQLVACMLSIAPDGNINKEKTSFSNEGQIHWHPYFSYGGDNFLYTIYDNTTQAKGLLIR